MCGIVGAAGKLDYKAREAFKDLLIICQLRGKDSTGVVRVDDDDKVDFLKDLGTPERMLDSKSFDKRIDVGMPKVLIGHCRHKTFGAVSIENAHPFNYDKVIGVHNGTLRNWNGKEKSRLFDVDSAWLYNNINDHGIEETITDLDKEGAWALVWWNKEENSLNFLRNKERTLHFCWSEDKAMMFWASEAWMLNAVARKMKVSIFEDGTFTRALAEDELWSFNIDRKAHGEAKVFHAAPVKKIKGKENSYSNFQYTGGRPHGTTGVHNSSTALTPVGGSNVTSPFDERVQLALKRLEEKEKLNDPLPETLTGTPQETTSIASTSPKVSNSSLTPSDGQTESNTGKTSSRPTLSLVSSNLKQSHTISRSVHSSVSNAALAVRALPHKMVSLRRVAGLTYITDLKSGIERSAHEFRVNTKGMCCAWCKNEVTIEEVNEIVTPNTFICDECSED